jgi:hypothetical protein
MADKSNYRAADDAYESQNDNATKIPGNAKDESYVSSDSLPVQVQSDSMPVDDPIIPQDSNSDTALGMLDRTFYAEIKVLLLTHTERDEKEAVDKSNILKERTRGAKVEKGSYSEGPDENDLPELVTSGDVGKSDIAQ